jgi:hypothetical protein
MEDEVEREYTIPPIRLNFADFMVAIATFVKGVCLAGVNAWEVIEVAFMAHSRSIAEKQAFQRDAGRAIEGMTTGVERDG